MFTWNNPEGKKAFWHSSAHLLAQAILSFYPEAKLTIGPAIENGFYYDVDFGNETISENDFKKIEDKMLEFARQKFEFEMREVSKEDALTYYKDQGNEFKVELIENLTDGDITFCDHSDFTDLCRGGHVPNTGIIKATKIMSVAGAYWRGDETRTNSSQECMAFPFRNKRNLRNILPLLEEAKKRDHRKLGKELELFAFSNKSGSGTATMAYQKEPL